MRRLLASDTLDNGSTRPGIDGLDHLGQLTATPHALFVTVYGATAETGATGKLLALPR